MLHVTNGDSVTCSLERASLPGRTLAWRDVHHDGPVPVGVTPLQLNSLRAWCLADLGFADWETAFADFNRRDDELAAALEAEEVVLWFEHDLYDQLQLLQILNTAAARSIPPSRLTLINIDRDPNHPRFLGLGQLAPQELANLFPTRAPVTAAALGLAARAWAAFRAPDPTDLTLLLESDTSPLPFLAPALLRHCRQFPDSRDGLSLSQRYALEGLLPGPKTVAQLFQTAADREPAPFLGDTSFMSHLRQVRALWDGAESSPSLFPADTPIALNENGRAVLEGRADALELCGIDRWLGGTMLVDPKTAWRWDEARQQFQADAHPR